MMSVADGNHKSPPGGLAVLSRYAVALGLPQRRHGVPPHVPVRRRALLGEGIN